VLPTFFGHWVCAAFSLCWWSLLSGAGPLSKLLNRGYWSSTLFFLLRQSSMRLWSGWRFWCGLLNLLEHYKKSKSKGVILNSYFCILISFPCISAPPPVGCRIIKQDSPLKYVRCVAYINCRGKYKLQWLWPTWRGRRIVKKSSKSLLINPPSVTHQPL